MLFRSSSIFLAWMMPADDQQPPPPPPPAPPEHYYGYPPPPPPASDYYHYYPFPHPHYPAPFIPPAYHPPPAAYPAYTPSPLRPPSHHPPHTPPFGSPRPGPWKNRTFSPRSPYSNTSSPSTQGPHSPASNSHPHHNHQPLLRGSLAQAKLRGHPIPDHLPLATLSLDHHHHHHNHHHRHNHHNHSHHSHKPALPKPPVHSQHALWVGNIPNDASHEELWKFFSAQRQQQAPLPGAGVESIHLIARSNCAFVNYISQAHLAQAIACSNGKPLRALDPYCKPLLCRIRKPEDNIKSGVGAQRIGGLHRSWIKRSDPAHSHAHHPKHRHTLPAPAADHAAKLPPSRENNHHHQQHSNSLNESSNIRTSSTLTAASNQSQSTTSSFLTSHFPRRYFILKAYTDEDLRISVDRSIWVSQTHNEPVLDQAYRTSAEGVYLIFSANQSGAFFGYARMAGPISGGTSARRARRKSLPPGSPAPEIGRASCRERVSTVV